MGGPLALPCPGALTLFRYQAGSVTTMNPSTPCACQNRMAPCNRGMGLAFEEPIMPPPSQEWSKPEQPLKAS